MDLVRLNLMNDIVGLAQPMLPDFKLQPIKILGESREVEKYHVRIKRTGGFFSGPVIGKLYCNEGGLVEATFTEAATREEMIKVVDILPSLNFGKNQ